MGRTRTEAKRQLYAANRRARYAGDPELRKARQQATQEWRRKNPENAARLAEQMAEKRLNENGFTLELKIAAIEKQRGRCAICETDLSSLPTKRVHADHCHKTIKPRGVLCQWCNAGLGGFKDNPEHLRAAIAYLENPPLADASD